MPSADDIKVYFTLAVEGCSEEIRVVSFDGIEAISSLYEVRVEFAASDELVIADLVGKAAQLTLHDGEDDRQLHGYVCQADYLGESRRYALYEITIVPWIWRLQQRAGHRIFQQKSTPEIIRELLDAAGLKQRERRFEISSTYAPRDYCTQYGESELDFISRLMESDGLYYYFVHDEDHCALVISDSVQCPTGAAVPFTSAAYRLFKKPCVTHLRIGELLRPTRVALRDTNLHTPATLDARAGTDPDREIYEYPGSYQQAGTGGPDRGGQQAKLRLQALQASARRGFGASNSTALHAGLDFELTGHPRAGVDGKYRVLRLSHRGEQPQVLDEATDREPTYTNDFECIDRETPYRAPRITPRPTVRGVQTATVVGPEGEEVHVDEHGRVKVKFHWDRSDVGDERSSCWVRVSQAWAGNGFGAMFLPRIGQEVIVDFIEGDPDRPLITGRIYTGGDKLPYPLPDQKTRSTILSDTSPGGGGSNELRFEDMKGSEEVYIHAQRDMLTAVEHDRKATVGHDDSLTVTNDRKQLVEHDETEEIKNDRTIKVGKNLTETIGADLKLDVGANHSTTISGGKSVSVKENTTETAGKNIVFQAGKHLSITTGENINLSSGKSTSVVVGDKLTIACGSATITVQSSGAVTIQTGGAVTVKGSSIKLN